MLTFHTVFSTKCHACKATKPIIRQIQKEYTGGLNLLFEGVENKDVYRFFQKNLAMRLDDPDTPDDIKQMMRASGESEYHALPTMYLTTSKRPMVIIWKAQGGVTNEDNDWRDKKDLHDEIVEIIEKFLKAENMNFGYWRDILDGRLEKKEEAE